MENRANAESRTSRDRLNDTPGPAAARPSDAQSSTSAASEYPRSSSAGQGARPSSTQPPREARAAGDRTPYQRTTPHITQEPIADDPTTYVTRDRYTTPDAARSRRHMGVATADPQYLPATEPARSRQRSNGTPGPAHPVSDKRAPLHYDRYLQTPKPGKSIFSARNKRAQRRARALGIAAVLVVIVLVLVWFFVLR